MELKPDRRKLSTYGEAPPIKEQRQSMMTDQNTVTPQVKRELMALDKMLMDIEKQLTELEARLHCVVTQDGPTPPKDTLAEATEDALVPMAGGVRELFAMAQDISNRIHSLTARLEV